MYKPEIFCIFSKPIYIDYLDIDNANVLKLLHNEEFKKIWNEKNLCETSIDRFILEKKELLFLKNKIMQCFQKYHRDILKYNYNSFKITTSWITKTNKKELSRIHNHNNSMFSGVLYLKTQPKKAQIVFHSYNKSHWSLRTSENNIYNSDTQTFDMSENLIIFFPSEVYHQIKVSEQDERISLAFNFVPTGKIGEINSDSYMEI